MNESPKRKTYDNVAAIDLLHQVSAMYSGTKKPHDYGTGESFTSSEMHILKCIADHPGITVTEIAYNYAKTKGAISQVLKKLIEKGLIVQKRPAAPKGKHILLYITERGKILNQAHLAYDEIHAGETMNLVRQEHSQEEIDIAFDVIESWLINRRLVHERRQREKRPSAPT